MIVLSFFFFSLIFFYSTSKTINNYCANIVFIKIGKASLRYLMKMCHDILNHIQTTGWKHINPRKVSHILGLFMSFSWIYICIEENNNRQPASPRWNTSVILFMHLSLLALLPCVLSLGGAACCAPESWHAQAEGRGSSGRGGGWGVRATAGSSMVTQREHALNTCSGSPPLHQQLFSWALTWPSGTPGGAGGWDIFLERSNFFFFFFKRDKVQEARRGMCGLKSADCSILVVLLWL